MREAAYMTHTESAPGACWSSINLAEAVPGVMTPLCASVWVPASEAGLRAPFRAMGALESRRASIPLDPTQRITNAFYGRMAVRVDFLCEMGDLIPGHSGEALARDFFGFVPPGHVSRPSWRRLPAILARYPRTLLTIARRIERLRRSTDTWWRREIGRIHSLDLAASQELVTEAVKRFTENLAAQAVVSACAIQPVQDQLDRMARSAGVDPAVLLRGVAHEESALLQDLWKVSRDTLSLEAFLARHGYHGPGEGEVITRVWREDSTSVRELVARYSRKPDTEAPGADAQKRAGERATAEHALFASASGVLGRARARLVLRLARRFIPLRGVGKVSYLQSIDVLRAAARHLGVKLVQDGRLHDADDAFYLTAQELAGRPVRDGAIDIAALTGERRKIREHYQSLTLPNSWTGQPHPRAPEPPVLDVHGLSGIGACAGSVEGRAVIVLDPADTDIEEGDVLVAHTTDPAWASLMFLASALVVDIGGLMSHAAVIAREMGIPCVMNTGNGTTVLSSGDLIRVDGAVGSVEILKRAEREPESST